MRDPCACVQQQFSMLKNVYTQGRLSHAYLLSGIAGTGKTNFARTFATYLLCEERCSSISTHTHTHTHTHTCHCRSCQWMNAHNHPDFMLITPEEKSRSIKINQIREISQKTTQTAHAGGYQVIVISPADTMPVQAANALLKTLEEPIGNVVIFLIDNNEGVLPATIVSRCQKIFFQSDHVDLRRHDGALTLRDQLLHHFEQIILRRTNPTAFPPAFLKIALSDTLKQLILLCSDLMRLQQHVDHQFITNNDAVKQLQTIAPVLSPMQLQSWVDKIIEKKAMVMRGVNLNVQLCLESIFIELYFTAHAHG